MNIDVIALKSVRDGAEMKWITCLSWKMVGHGQQIPPTYPNRECHSGEPYFTEQILKVSSDQLQANLRKQKYFLTTW